MYSTSKEMYSLWERASHKFVHTKETQRISSQSEAPTSSPCIRNPHCTFSKSNWLNTIQELAADDLRNDGTANGGENDRLWTTTVAKILVPCSSASAWVQSWVVSTSVHVHCTHTGQLSFLFDASNVTSFASRHFQRDRVHMNHAHTCSFLHQCTYVKSLVVHTHWNENVRFVLGNSKNALIT